MRMVMQAEAWGYDLQPWRRWYKENILVAEFTPSGPPPRWGVCPDYHALSNRGSMMFPFEINIIGEKSKHQWDYPLLRQHQVYTRFIFVMKSIINISMSDSMSINNPNFST